MLLKHGTADPQSRGVATFERQRDFKDRVLDFVHTLNIRHNEFVRHVLPLK